MIETNNTDNELKTYFQTFFTAAGILMFLGILALFSADISAHDSATVIATESQEETKPFINPFISVNLEADAAYVVDLNTGEVLFSKNPEQQLPLASLTKLMTALLVEKSIETDDEIQISKEAIAQEGESYFDIGERWRISDLIDFTLLTSSNDGAYALASVVESNPSDFIRRMNREADDLGLVQTYFIGVTGLDANTFMSGSNGSVRDVASLFGYILVNKPTLVEETRLARDSFTSLDGKVYDVENTNTIVGKIPGLLGSKTGFTDLAGGNLVIGFDAGIGRPIVVAVLGSSKLGRFTDIEQLVAASRAYIQKK